MVKDESDERENERGHHKLKRRKHDNGDERPVERERGRELPFDARPLTKDDMDKYRAVFTKYLRDKKDIHIDDISSTETYARFKSFVHKWNEGDLSSKYYDPELIRKRRHSSHSSHEQHRTHSPEKSRTQTSGVYPRHSKIVGPTLPTHEDLQLQKEQRIEDAEEADRLRYAERKAQRRLAKERLDELVPRAEAGTRERRLEKRAETNAVMRAFRDKSPEITVSDATLMGGDDIKADLLREKAIEAAREARRDEIYRAKEAERLKRRSDLEKREDGTMGMLKKLAQERWGSGNPA